ncbi:MAG TPA: hypothetical protein VKZ53_09040 [Candidatus Angelobacter sp.]|nr:hypothetical protein [Candidatus Angelobacter sp.]
MNRSQPEKRISEALRSLAKTPQREAPPELYGRLSGAFHRHHARRQARAMRMLAAAACLIAAILAGWQWRKMDIFSSLPQPPTIAKVPAPPTPAAPTLVGTNHSQIPAPVPVPHRRRAGRTGDTQAAQASAFLALPAYEAGAPLDDLRVVRLDMLGADLRLIGVPISERIADRHVQADFLVGRDGTPYAMRPAPFTRNKNGMSYAASSVSFTQR